jgi:Xaa-Pro aminopeptidase
MSIDEKRTMGIGAKRQMMSTKGLLALMDDEEVAARPRAPLEPGMVVTVEPGM